MKEIHKKCKEHGEGEDRKIDYVKERTSPGLKRSRYDIGVWACVKKDCHSEGTKRPKNLVVKVGTL